MIKQQNDDDDNERVFTDQQLEDMRGHRMKDVDDIDLFDADQVAMTETLGDNWSGQAYNANELYKSMMITLSGRPVCWWQRIVYELAHSPDQTLSRQLVARQLLNLVKFIQNIEDDQLEIVGDKTYGDLKRPLDSPPEFKVEI